MRGSKLPLGAVFLALSSIARMSGATEYFVDEKNGDDAFSGTAESSAFRTLAPLSGATFLEPGDFVRLKRGGVWDVTSLGSSGFIVSASGTKDAPITISSFGDGDAPVVSNASRTTLWVRDVSVHGAFIVVENLHLKGAHESAIVLEKEGRDAIVRGIEIDGTGTGILVKTEGNLVEKCFFHDLLMVNDTPGGDDDYGAVAVQLQASNNEVSHNRMERCVAPSQDYGVDGGAVEIYLEEGTPLVENLSIHHNWASDGEGFVEIGGRGGMVRDVALDHNVSVDNRLLGVLHNGGTNFTVTIEGLSLTNNTIVESKGARADLLFSPSPLDEKALHFRNNIVSAGAGFSKLFPAGTFAHDHNLYALGEGVELGFELAETELLGDPGFVDFPARDFHLEPASIAIDAGIFVSEAEDFDGKPIDGAPDFGAYEFHGAQTGNETSPKVTAGCACSNASAGTRGFDHAWLLFFVALLGRFRRNRAAWFSTVETGSGRMDQPRTPT